MSASSSTVGGRNRASSSFGPLKDAIQSDLAGAVQGSKYISTPEPKTPPLGLERRAPELTQNPKPTVKAPSGTTPVTAKPCSVRSTGASTNHTKTNPPPSPFLKVGYWGSIAIAVNNLTGPGMLDLPSTFQKSGVVPTTVCIVFMAILSSVTSLSLSNAIGKIRTCSNPSNSDFQNPIEYSSAFLHYRGRLAFNVTQVCFFLCIMSQAVASIITTSQVVDAIFASVVGRTWGLSLSFNAKPEIMTWNPSNCRQEVDSKGESDAEVDYGKWV